MVRWNNKEKHYVFCMMFRTLVFNQRTIRICKWLFLCGTIFNKNVNLIGVLRHWSGNNVQSYHVIAKFDNTDVFEMYKQQFARMRAYVVKHELV